MICEIYKWTAVKKFDDGNEWCRLPATVREEVSIALAEESVHESVWHVLRALQMRASWNIRQPRSVWQVLHRHVDSRQPLQVPLDFTLLSLLPLSHPSIFHFSPFYFMCLNFAACLYVPHPTPILCVVFVVYLPYLFQRIYSLHFYLKFTQLHLKLSQFTFSILKLWQ